MDFTRDEFEMLADCVRGRAPKGWARANCPLCDQMSGKFDKKQSFAFNFETGGFVCNKCGIRGRLPNDMCEDLGVDLGFFSGDPEIAKEPERRPNCGMPRGFVPIFEPPWDSYPMLERARRYLTGPRDEPINDSGQKCRGLKAEACRHYGIGVGTGFLSTRVVVPIYDMEDPSAPWVGWFARRFDGDGAPHLYSKGLDRSRAHFNWPALLTETDEPLIVVEGCLDVVALHPFDGYPLLGKVIESHFELFRRLRRPIAFAMDGDASDDGWSMMLRARMLGVRAGCVHLGPGLDPDEVPLDALVNAARRSISVAGRVRL